VTSLLNIRDRHNENMTVVFVRGTQRLWESFFGQGSVPNTSFNCQNGHAVKVRVLR
jgi:hypothetical protein